MIDSFISSQIMKNLSITNKGDWCDSNGTIEGVKAKVKTKEGGAIKRKRTWNYVCHPRTGIL